MSQSASPSSHNLPTNDAIIDDLTKDLESQFVVDKNTNNVNDISSDINESIEKEISSQIPDDFEASDSETTEITKPAVPDDYIDEEALKDVELTLTEEEKETRHKKVLELKNKGNEEFKNEKYFESVNTYTEALRLCPLMYATDRSVLYANRGASKIKLDRNKCAIDDCTKAIELNDKYVRAYLRRAKLYEDTDKLDECLEDYKKVLEFDPGNKDALSASHRLPPLINERNEKLKTEMMGKLKDLGNMFLRPFGLSTENFNLNQDPNTGGYSINFQQNSS